MENDCVRGTLVPNSYLEPLGRLFVWFCLLEESLDNAIILFLGTNEINGAIVVRRNTSVVGKIGLLTALAKQRLNEGQMAKLEKAISKISCANDKRNKIVHGKWGYLMNTDSGPTVTKKTVSTTGNPSITPLHLEYINKSAQEAYDAQVALDATILSLGL